MSQQHQGQNKNGELLIIHLDGFKVHVSKIMYLLLSFVDLRVNLFLMRATEAFILQPRDVLHNPTQQLGCISSRVVRQQRAASTGGESPVGFTL